MDGVVLKEVHEVFGVHEGIVDGGDRGLVCTVSESRAEDEATNSTETVDSESSV